MYSCVSWATSGVAVRPVPIAQTGSYAMTMSFIISAETPLRPSVSCTSHTLNVSPDSRSSLSSPIHRMHLRPSPRILSTFLFVSASLSPKTERRSEWPASTYVQPTDLSMAVEVAPVYAPDSSQWQSCAPRPTFEPSRALATEPRNGKGAQTATSDDDPAAASATALARETASGSTVFIFQLPAMSGVRSAIMETALVRTAGRAAGVATW
mmetsp:Transcript_3856/g.6358  ORF Transcript_3856/g.6358 Transcript_3856/m.6358 type:complete len:210 (+) Transcript_3856:434-1063(+)